MRSYIKISTRPNERGCKALPPTFHAHVFCACRSRPTLHASRPLSHGDYLYHYARCCATKMPATAKAHNRRMQQIKRDLSLHPIDHPTACHDLDQVHNAAQHRLYLIKRCSRAILLMHPLRVGGHLHLHHHPLPHELLSSSLKCAER